MNNFVFFFVFVFFASQVILGEYSWITYNDMSARVDNFGKGMLAVNAQPGNNIVIYAETRAEWMISAQACFKYNFPGKILLL